MIEFAKAHACGNDFLIVDRHTVADVSLARVARQLCARTTGVGADGVEYFEWLGEFAGRVKLYNSDGSPAEISGNGTRCVAAWMAHERGAGAGAVLRIETDAGVRECRSVTCSGNKFEIVSGMGVPSFHSAVVELKDGVLVHGAVVNTGNPHFVIRVQDADWFLGERSWQSVGEEICFHADFPQQTNVEFVRTKSESELEIRIFERGVGPTASSGTGTCAAATAAIALHGCIGPLRVVAPGGAQQVEWGGAGTEIHLTGPAALVARGQAWVDGAGA